MDDIFIRTAEDEEVEAVSRVLAPAFHDKVMLVVGEEEKALRIIPELIRSIVGETFVAIKTHGDMGGNDDPGPKTGEDAWSSMNAVSGTRTDEGKEEMVGAIIISTKELKIRFRVIRACFRQLGLVGSFRAFRKVYNYLGSIPEKGRAEGTLEAVGVLEDWRGQGIGEKLVCRGEEYLRDHRKDAYGLGVKIGNGAVKLYEKLGFTTISRFENNLGTWLYMRKDLQ